MASYGGNNASFTVGELLRLFCSSLKDQIKHRMFFYKTGTLVRWALISGLGTLYNCIYPWYPSCCTFLELLLYSLCLISTALLGLDVFVAHYHTPLPLPPERA